MCALLVLMALCSLRIGFRLRRCWFKPRGSIRELSNIVAMGSSNDEYTRLTTPSLAHFARFLSS